eukprot:1466608-Pyramimonas_sp.AAC.1
MVSSDRSSMLLRVPQSTATIMAMRVSHVGAGSTGLHKGAPCRFIRGMHTLTKYAVEHRCYRHHETGNEMQRTSTRSSGLFQSRPSVMRSSRRFKKAPCVEGS